MRVSDRYEDSCGKVKSSLVQDCRSEAGWGGREPYNRILYIYSTGLCVGVKGRGGRALHGQTMYAYYIGTTAVWRWMNHEEAASMLLKLMSTVVLG